MTRALPLWAFALLAACRVSTGVTGTSQEVPSGAVLVKEAPITDGASLALSAKHGVETISVGTTHGCAVASNGVLACWGSNERQEIGHGFSSGWCDPARVRGVRDVTAVAIGRRYTCAVQSEHTVACWGDHPAAAVASEFVADSHRFDVDVPIAQIAAAPTLACIRTRDGAVSCWGSAEHGQLGDSATPDAISPVRLELSPAVGMAIGEGLGCIVNLEGGLECWGRLGSIVVGKHAQDAVFGPTVIPAPAADAVMLAGSAPCIVDRDGELRCWLERTAGPPTPVPHPVAVGIQQIERVLGLTDDGSGCAVQRDDGGRTVTKCWRGSSLRDYGWAAYPGSPSASDITLFAVSPLSATTSATASAAPGLLGCSVTSDESIECWTTDGSVFQWPRIDFASRTDAPDICANPDQDGDGIPDNVDACPTEAESFNRRADSDGCPDEGESLVAFDARTSRISLLEDIAFTSPRVGIQARSDVTLDHLASLLTAHAEFDVVEIRPGGRGRSRSRGGTARRRAVAVRDALVERGIDPKRLWVQTEPKPGDTADLELFVHSYATALPAKTAP